MRRRIGSVIPIENVDPHKGSFLDYGVIVGYQDKHGNACSRKNAKYVIVEPSGGKFAEWSEWAENHAGKLVTLDEFESNLEEVSDAK